jgi:hypothetical protein
MLLVNIASSEKLKFAQADFFPFQLKKKSWKCVKLT